MPTERMMRFHTVAILTAAFTFILLDLSSTKADPVQAHYGVPTYSPNDFGDGFNSIYESNFSEIGQSPPALNTTTSVKFFFYGDWSDVDTCWALEVGNTTSLATSGYNPSLPLKLLIHGILSNSLTHNDIRVVKDAYLRARTEANIVMVDYGLVSQSNLPLILTPFTFTRILTSLFRTKRIGNDVAQFIEFLLSTGSLDSPDSIHIIGFGLGAHIAGAAGRQVRLGTGHNINRITGLNPSYQFPIKQIQLDPSDASFVDVSFTTYDSLPIRRRGHIQFFINGGGPFQPNCPRILGSTLGCSHHAANFYFAKSIEKAHHGQNMLGCKCLGTLCTLKYLNTHTPSCVDPIAFGEQLTRTAIRGNYYVTITY